MQGALLSISMVVFLVILLVFIVLSMILTHHWKRYGIKEGTVKKIKQIYFAVALAILFFMIMSLLFAALG